jgi:monoamine oxidase
MMPPGALARGDIMAGTRTPLFRLFRRAIASAQAARRSPAPLDEVIDEVVERRRAYSRRRFLRDTGTGAAALMLAACAPRAATPAKAGDEREVAIVGAGIAGLTAAWRLRQAGIRARVYEASERVGGRMYSLRDHFPDGQVVELGGELIDTSHVRIQALAAELGLPLDDLLADSPELAAEVWHFGGRRYDERDLIEALAPLTPAIERDQARLPDADITYAATHGLQDLDALSLAQWLDREGVDGWLRALIDVAYTTEMGAEPELQSALNLIDFIGIEPEHFSLFGDSDERFHVRGGNDLVPLALAERLDDAIETGMVLEAVAERAGGRVVLDFRQGSASRQVEADLVILALPFTTLRQVRITAPLSPVKRRAIDELGYGANAKLMIGFNRRVWREHGSNGSVFTDLPLQSTWETSRAQAGEAGILTNFTGGEHARSIGAGAAGVQAARAVAGLDTIFPGSAAARDGALEVRFHWPTYPWVRASYACYGPGQWTTLRGAAGERAGGLLFAGEHCAMDNQGFMEGGCETGEAAAAEVLATLGVRAAG